MVHRRVGVTMSEKDQLEEPPAGNEKVERRKGWQDRRSGNDRRNAERLRLVSYDCRTGLPRREADRTGELSDGEIWWRK